MSDDIQHINVDDEQWDGTPRALREHVDKLQKALKAANQTITGFETERASTALSGVLTGFKNPERVKSALLADKVDPLDQGAVAKWLESNGDDYAKATGDPEPPAEDTTAQAAASRAGLDALSQIGTPGTANVLDVINSMPQDLGPKEAREWLIQHGA